VDKGEDCHGVMRAVREGWRGWRGLGRRRL
jgi:hypothetical protein